MKKVAIGLALAGLILVVIPMAYSTAKGYMTWWFTVPGAKVSMAGSPIDAWVHRGQTWQDILVTLQEGENRVSYHWILGEDRVNGHCPAAPAFPIFAEGDLMDPDCFSPLPEGTVVPEPPKREVVFGPRALGFVADDGKRIEVRW